MVKRGRPPKMTAEEGMASLEQKQIITESGMTRLQNKMSVKQASKFRRLVRERAKLWCTMQERVFTKSLREKGGQARKKAIGFGFDGRSRYIVENAAIGVPVQNGRGMIIPFVYRYPDGNIVLDLRLWGVREDEAGDYRLTPTRKGFTMPMAKVYRLTGGLQALYQNWKRKNPGQVEEPSQQSREERRRMAKIRRFLEKTDSE